MTDRELEHKLRQAMEHAAPDDLEGLLSRCGPQKGTVIPMKKERTAKRRFLPLIAAACLVVLIAGGAFGLSYRQSNAVASIVSLDVNPSIELKLNSREKVLAATPLNSDAVIVLDGMDLVGDDLNKAMNAIIGSLLKNGYVDELANSILITVEDDDAARAASLQQKLNEEANAILAGASVSGAVLTQVLENSAQLQEQATYYGISAGKAALIQTIVDASGGTQTFEQLVGLSINDLNLLSAGLTQTTATTLTSTGTASQGAYIGTEAAQTAALKHAGVSASAATIFKTEFDHEDGRMVYGVEFRAGETQYDYDIDASTGDVVSCKQEIRVTQASKGTDIGAEAAKSAALKHAGLSASDVTGMAVQQDYDDGVFAYDVEFWSGTTEYDYEIDGYDATVISWQVKFRTGVATGNSASGTTVASGTDIGAEAAQTAALSAAGLSASQVTGMKVERDYDDGRLEYEVEFRDGSTKYDYTVSGTTGAILASDIERGGSSQTGTSGTDIGTDAAKAAAFSAAGVAAGDATSVRVERDYDNGRLKYEVEFWNGTTEYDYEIDGYTGSVISYDTEIHAAASSTSINAETALSAALSHAGVSQANAYEIEVEQELDDYTPHYEVQFKSGGMEYEYKIDAASGAVLTYESEWD